MQFVIIGLDGTDEEANNRRQKVRQEHIEMGEKLLSEGNLLYGAALLNEDGDMNGSMYVVNFAGKPELEKYLETEPYVIGKVWQDVQIYRSSTRDPWQFSHEKAWFEKYLRDN